MHIVSERDISALCALCQNKMWRNIAHCSRTWYIGIVSEHNLSTLCSLSAHIHFLEHVIVCLLSHVLQVIESKRLSAVVTIHVPNLTSIVTTNIGLLEWKGRRTGQNEGYYTNIEYCAICQWKCFISKCNLVYFKILLSIVRSVSGNVTFVGAFLILSSFCAIFWLQFYIDRRNIMYSVY